MHPFWDFNLWFNLRNRINHSTSVSTFCPVSTPTTEHTVSTYRLLPAASKHVAFIFYRLQRERRPSATPSLERYRSVKQKDQLCINVDVLDVRRLNVTAIFTVSFFVAFLSKNVKLNKCKRESCSLCFIHCASFCSSKSTTTSSLATWSFMSCRPGTLSRGTTMATLTHLLKFISYQGEGESRVWKLQAHLA